MKIIFTLIFYLLLLCSFASAATMTLVSDTTNQYWDGSTWQSAVATWIHPLWPSIPGATWVWNSYVTNEPNNGETLTFQKTFELPKCNKEEYSGNIQITADNRYILEVNGHAVGFGMSWATINTYNISTYLHAGQNKLEVIVQNDECPNPQVGCDPYNNPGGLLYSAEVGYDDQTCNQVPEFTTIGAGIALIGAGAVYFARKRK